MNITKPIQTHSVFSVVIGSDLDQFAGQDGHMYDLALSAHDALSLPQVPFTTVRVLKSPLRVDASPNVWRAAMVDADKIIEIESTSDAGQRPMIAEARGTWEGFRAECHKRAKWMGMIGIHPDIKARMESACQVNLIRIATLDGEYLERMFATGNAEVARAAVILNQLCADGTIHLGTADVFDFLWPDIADLRDHVAKRFARARAGDWTLISDSIYRP